MKYGVDRVLVRGHSTHPLTHGVLWLGTVDASDIVWSTEDAPDALQLSSMEFLAAIPTSVVASCTDCKLMLQVAHVEDLASTGVYSEERFVIDARNGT